MKDIFVQNILQCQMNTVHEGSCIVKYIYFPITCLVNFPWLFFLLYMYTIMNFISMKDMFI